jgi:hypothetical protein
VKKIATSRFADEGESAAAYFFNPTIEYDIQRFSVVILLYIPQHVLSNSRRETQTRDVFRTRLSFVTITNKMSATLVQFHSGHEKFGEFSNAFPLPFSYEGQVYVTAEHCIKAKMRDELLGEDEDGAQGTGAKLLDRERTESVDELVRHVVHAKFSQHADLRALLLSTGTCELMEDADGKEELGPTTSGTDLGKILMAVRSRLRKESSLESKIQRKSDESQEELVQSAASLSLGSMLNSSRRGVVASNPYQDASYDEDVAYGEHSDYDSGGETSDQLDAYFKAAYDAADGPDALSDAISAAISNQISDEVSKQISNAISDQISDELQRALDEQLEQELEREYGDDSDDEHKYL